jgi:hypothetical protein
VQRAVAWGAIFFVFSWLLVFSHTLDAVLLGLGAGAVALAVYRHELPAPIAMGVAASEVAARLLLLGVGDALIVPLVSICVAEIIGAAVMSIDAVSSRDCEITAEFLPRRPTPVPEPVEEPAPATDPAPEETEPVPSVAKEGAAGRTRSP